MLAELHCHSTYSTGSKINPEGLDTPEQMVRHAKVIGLDIIAITDHDTLRGGLEAKKYAKKYGMVVIPGEEVTTFCGHVLALGIQENIKCPLSFYEALDSIRSQGGIAVASHPFDVKKVGVGRLALKCDAMEAFNALNVERISNWKASYLAKKHKFPSVANSDAHCSAMIGYGKTDIRCEADLEAILKAIKKGRTTMHAQYIPTKIIMEWAVERLKLSYAYTLDYMNQNYRWPKRTVYKKLLGLVNKSPGNIDYLFRLITYFSLGNIFIFQAFREILRI